MKIELEIENCYCDTKVFKINDIIADSKDFGIVEDIEPYNLEEADEFDDIHWCCGNAKFIINMDRKHVGKIMTKYQITFEEYKEIADLLEKKLSFGSCCYCL